VNRDTIRKVLGEFDGGDRAYHESLPPELAAWHCYTTDGGHCVLVIFPGDFGEGDLTKFLCPVPVKAVLRAGFEIRSGWVVCDLPYSPKLGLLTDPGDDEF